ncbi:MAG: diguanylate cyclase domain-containing protein [Planctomycetota bacterium]|jgi:diguanylate cyclase (GGDEF)-like protein/PAS domain S-box-containing protein
MSLLDNIQGAPDRTPEIDGGFLRRLWLALFELLGIFVADMLLPAEVSLGAFYAVPLLFCFEITNRREVILVAVASGILTPIGALYGSDGYGGATISAVVAALTGLFAVFLTARLVLLRLDDEERLFANRELNEIALGSTADGVIVTDNDGRVVWINLAAERLLGWRMAEAVGMELDELVRREDLPTEPLKTAERPSESRILVRLRSGSHLQVEITEGTIRDLARRPQGQVLVLRDDSQRAELENALYQRAYYDRLTELPNRAALSVRMDLELDHARRDKSGLGVLFLDLDRFKQVNDQLGHNVGDDLLRGVALRLRAALRDSDTIARLAGDEFVVIVPKIKGREDVELVAAKVIEALSRPFDLSGEIVSVGTSVGLALFGEHGTTRQELLKAADSAMYVAKRQGGSTYAFAGSSNNGEGTPQLEGPA